MLSSLVATALLMGFAGGPHCVAMCGAATAGIGCTQRRLWSFQAGRLVGYSVLVRCVSAEPARFAVSVPVVVSPGAVRLGFASRGSRVRLVR